MNHRRLLFVFSLCLFSAAGVRAAAPAFDSWADGFAAEWVRLNPQLATRTQYFSGAEQNAIDRQLVVGHAYGGTYGAKAAQKAAELARRGLEELARFPSNDLSATQRTSAAVIKWTLEDAIAGAEFAHHQFVYEQIGGFHLMLVEFLTTTHPIRNTSDIDNYLARLGLAAAVIDEGIAETKAAQSAGIIAPRFILQRVIEQIDGFVATPPADNVFVKTLNERIGGLGSAVSAEERTRFVASAENVVRASVLPAYQRIRDTLAAQLPGGHGGRRPLALTAWPGGLSTRAGRQHHHLADGRRDPRDRIARGGATRN